MKITARQARATIARMRAAGILVIAEPYNSGGPGGQHSNTTLNAYRLVGEHVVYVDGVQAKTITIRAECSLKSQHKSLVGALRVYRSRLADARRRIEGEHSAADRVSKLQEGDFGGAGRVRTYHEPDNRVVDSTGARATYRETIEGGKDCPIIDARRERMLTSSSRTTTSPP